MAAGKLTAIKVDSLSETGRYADGDGLYLDIAKGGQKSWLFRYRWKDKRPWMGLGGYSKKTNTLAIARAKALEYRALISRGIDPQEHQRQETEKAKAKEQQAKHKNQLNEKTFRVVAKEYIASKKSEWSNDKHAQQWTNTLTAHAFPIIGDKAMNDLGVTDIMNVLEPIWYDITETASRVRQRTESVISYSIAKHYREREKGNPAVWKGLLDQMLPKPEKVKRKRHEEKGEDGHFLALPYEQMPEFIYKLNSRLEGSTGARALKFLILTVTRTTEVRGMKWEELNLDKKVWDIPAGRMKGRKAHRVALSDSAISLLEQQPKISEYVFPCHHKREFKPLSNAGMDSVLKRMEYKDVATVHGFRSSFRDYIGEETGFPFRLAEFALAHQLKDGAEKAYARGDMLKKRFTMMNAWADYLASHKVKGKVAHIKSALSG